MAHVYDAALKAVVTAHARDFAPVFALPAIEPAQNLNVDLSTLSAATDAALGFGDPIREITESES